MEAELKNNFPDASIELVRGSGGVFDVICDDKVIYSKQNNNGHRFPDDGEITGLIKHK